MNVKFASNSHDADLKKLLARYLFAQLAFRHFLRFSIPFGLLVAPLIMISTLSPIRNRVPGPLPELAWAVGLTGCALLALVMIGLGTALVAWTAAMKAYNRRMVTTVERELELENGEIKPSILAFVDDDPVSQNVKNALVEISRGTQEGRVFLGLKLQWRNVAIPSALVLSFFTPKALRRPCGTASEMKRE